MKIDYGIDKDNKNVLRDLVCMFVVLQPLLDICIAVVGEKFEVIGMSVATLIRIVFVASLLIYSMYMGIKDKKNIKVVIGMAIFIALILLYSVVHHYNITMSQGYFVSNGLYSLATELNYILRLSLPIILIFDIYMLNIRFRDIKDAIIFSGMIFSLVIIITNLLGISFTSYGSAVNSIKIIKGTIIDWFLPNTYSFEDLASKGFFASANQISGILSIILAVVCYETYKMNNKANYFKIAAIGIAMIMLGTRTATYVLIALLSILILLFIIRSMKNMPALVKNKEKVNNAIDIKKQAWGSVALCLVFLVLAYLYSVSPQISRKGISDYEKDFLKNKEENEEVFQLIEDTKKLSKDQEAFKAFLGATTDNYEQLRAEYISDVVSKTYLFHYINTQYIKNIYPYQDDIDFWFDLYDKPFYIKADNRKMELEIIERIKENNNNLLLDTLFGLGATPLNQRGYMIENDLLAHYYNLGIIGTLIFVGPYIAIVILGTVYLVIKSNKTKKIVLEEETIALVAIAIMIFIGYLCGHIIDEYVITMIIATIAGTLLVSFKNKEGVFDVPNVKHTVTKK